MTGAMLDQKGASGKAKLAPNFAMDPAQEWLCALDRLAHFVCGHSVAEALRWLPNSFVPKRADHLGASQ
jgi:hypothetical protein